MESSAVRARKSAPSCGWCAALVLALMPAGTWAQVEPHATRGSEPAADGEPNDAAPPDTPKTSPEPVAEPGTVTKTEADSETGTATGTEADSETTSETGTATGTEAYPQTKTKTGTATKLETTSGTGTATKLETTSGTGTGRLRYVLDPVTDTVILASTLIMGIGSEMTVRSGELQAQPPGPIENIPAIDRWVAETDDAPGDPKQISNLGIYALGAYAIADAVRSGYRDGPAEGWTEMTLYVESFVANWALSNIVKLTVRRPRPVAYIEAEAGSPDTNRRLSFYSGHTAAAAGLTGTASYLAFERDPDGWQPWVTLASGLLATGAVGFQRVYSRSHFPSDVIAGAVFGGAVGVLVPHLHRADPDASVRLGVWADGGGGGATLSIRN